MPFLRRKHSFEGPSYLVYGNNKGTKISNLKAGQVQREIGKENAEGRNVGLDPIK